MNKDCLLCQLIFKDDIRTKHHGDSTYWRVVDCDTCHMPMAVLRRHSMTLLPREYEDLGVVWRSLFPDRTARMQVRKVKDHFHVHFVEQGNLENAINGG